MCWGKGFGVSWVLPPVFSFLLAGLEQHRNWEGVAIWDRRSGVSKANSRSGLACLLGEVLDLYEKSSGEVASVLFDFCDNMPWGVAAELASVFGGS